MPIAPSRTRIRSESSFSNNWRVWTWAMTAMRDCVCVTCYWEKDLAARVRVRADCGTWPGNDVDRCCEASMANDFTTIAHNPLTCKLAQPVPTEVSANAKRFANTVYVALPDAVAGGRVHAPRGRGTLVQLASTAGFRPLARSTQKEQGSRSLRSEPIENNSCTLRTSTNPRTSGPT